MSQRFLVTGATGFIGKHLCRHLVESNMECHVVVRQSSDLSRLEPYLERIQVHVHDGRSEHLQDLVEKAQPDVCVHLATHFLSRHTTADIGSLIEANVLFGCQLLEAMSQLGIRRFINTGTAWQHYQNEAFNPVCLYAATKQAFQDLARYYQECHQLNFIQLSLHDTYGPMDHRRKLFNLLAEAIKTGQSLQMSPGEQLIDLLHVEDVIAAIMQAAEVISHQDSMRRPVYMLSSKNPIALKALVGLFGEAWGTAVPVQFGARPYRDREVMVPWNTGPILPGWRPRISLQAGLASVIEDYRSPPI